MMAELDYLPALLALPVLVAVAYNDMRFMRIPGWLPVVLALIFLLTAPMIGWDETVARIAVALAVFVLCFFLQVIRVMGGGDVRTLSAIMLIVPSASLLFFLQCFSIALVAGCLITLVLHPRPVPSDNGWAASRARGHLPMGLSVAVAGFALASLGLVSP